MRLNYYLIILGSCAILFAVLPFLILLLIGFDRDSGIFFSWMSLLQTAGSLLSGFGVVLLAVSLYLQHKELSHTLLAQQEATKAVERRASTEQKHFRVLRTMELYDMWHSDEFNHWRICAADTIKRGIPIKSLSRIDSYNNMDTKVAIFGIVHFFERWSLLLQHDVDSDGTDYDLLNDKLLYAMLGSYVHWWYDNYFKELLELDEEIEHLSTIKDNIKYLFDHYKRLDKYLYHE